MSRIGRAPISIPNGVTVTVADNKVTVKGPLGQLERDFDSRISVKVENNQVLVLRSNDEKEVKALHGLYRALIQNMVNGVVKEFEKALIVHGVGYKMTVVGKKLTMNIGFSHPIEIEAPEGISFALPQPLELVVKGIDKELVGQVAAMIKFKKPVEPYHGYGIHYKDEVVLRKEGKKAGK